VTDEIMYALMELSGQEYVDEDAQRAKSRPRAGRKLPARGGRATAVAVPAAGMADGPGGTTSGPGGESTTEKRGARSP